MVYQALARQWRPKKFSEVMGQLHVVKALTQALDTQRLHHAYLFTGTHGTGKTTVARILAKCVSCETGITSTPCGTCATCKEIDAGCFPDLYEIDAASRTKVEDTRELLDKIPYAPTVGRYKIYLIDEVHMLSGHSFNALLKTLEEPPTHVLFLLATTDPQKLPATVLSRCLQFHLQKMSLADIEQQLSMILKHENIAFEPTALTLFAQAAQGSMRDSLSLLDQCIAYCGKKITLKEAQQLLGLTDQADLVTLLEYISTHNTQGALALTTTWATNGINFTRCLSSLMTTLYRVALMHAVGYADPALKNLAAHLSPTLLTRYYQIALAAQRNIAFSPTAQIGFEMMVMEMVSLDATPSASAQGKTETKASDWLTLFTQLKLSGQARALAQHCAQESFADNQLTLVLAPTYRALFHEQQREIIQNACAEYLGHPIKLTITVGPHSKQTPTAQQTAQKTVVKNAIIADPTVQKMMETFGATINEDDMI